MVNVKWQSFSRIGYSFLSIKSYWGKNSNLIIFFFLQNSGIDRLIPDMMIDDYQFDPCGYSMNGLMRTVPVSKSITSERNDLVQTK